MVKGFHIATDRCYGCRTCSVICANEHLLTPGVFIRRVREYNTSKPTGQAFISMSCNHCDEPACAANCPVGAYTKDPETGLVIQDHSKCTGCKTCIEACPFHAPCYDEETSTTYKCDGCISRLNQGLDPVCVIGCPSMNIAFGDTEKLPAGESIKDLVDTKPNFSITADPDIDMEIFKDIDDAAGIVNIGIAVE